MSTIRQKSGLQSVDEHHQAYVLDLKSASSGASPSVWRMMEDHYSTKLKTDTAQEEHLGDHELSFAESRNQVDPQFSPSNACSQCE